MIEKVTTVAPLPRGTACEFEVFFTQLCITIIDDTDLLVVLIKDVKDVMYIPLGTKAETEVSTKLHDDDVGNETQNREGSFGVIFQGTFRVNELLLRT